MQTKIKDNILPHFILMMWEKDEKCAATSFTDFVRTQARILTEHVLPQGDVDRFEADALSWKDATPIGTLSLLKHEYDRALA